MGCGCVFILINKKACLQGTYNAVAGTSTCMACASGLNTASNKSTSAFDCDVCDVGYGGYAPSCTGVYCCYYLCGLLLLLSLSLLLW